MRALIATISTETNTFAPMPTNFAAFEQAGLFRNDASRHPGAALFNPLMAAWRALLEQEGVETVESVCAFAHPAGRVTASAYGRLRDMLLDDLRAGGPFDLLLLNLHGAMAADGVDDCEGALLAAARDVVGSRCVIGVLLDLHCHLTVEMARAADILVAYKEYPHTDVGARALETLRLSLRAARGEVNPTTAFYACDTIGIWRTGQEPIKSFVAHMQALEERPGVLSASLGHGFPWADVPTVGSHAWVITDADPALADAAAQDLATRWIALQKDAAEPLVDLDDALRRIESAEGGLITVADLADNAGGGAPADSTFLLEALLRSQIRDVALGVLWDPVATEIAVAAGEGGRLPLRIGGKVGTSSGRPCDVEALVRGVRRNHAAPGLGGIIRYGDAAWIEAQGIHVVISTLRAQTFHPEAFTGLGLDLAGLRAVVVKSMEHFRAEFAQISAQILYANTPGALRVDYASIPYTQRKAEYWPKVGNPTPRRVA